MSGDSVRTSIVVAIDGPAGAGKSTVARRVALALGLDYLDTGAMYRAVALEALRRHIPATDAAALARIARTLAIRFGPLQADATQRVFLAGEDVTEAIRAPEVSRMVSPISTHAPVRQELVARQRALGHAAAKGVVLEGRDTGTVVFPDADVKIFLTASPEERARRRTEELRSRGMPADLSAVLAEQNLRDQQDSTRATSPLRPAPGAIEIHTDGMSVAEVVARVTEQVLHAARRSTPSA